MPFSTSVMIKRQLSFKIEPRLEFKKKIVLRTKLTKNNKEVENAVLNYDAERHKGFLPIRKTKAQRILRKMVSSVFIDSGRVTYAKNPLT